MKREVRISGSLFLISVLLVQVGCAGKDCVDRYDPLEPEQEMLEVCEIADPLEPVNRAVHAFNDSFYSEILEPVDAAYERLPEMFRKGVRNFFHNASSPVRFIGAAMQGKSDAGYVAGEFVINTLLGFGGIFDLTKHQYADDEDIGQGLAAWGIGEGCYVILPFFGPRTFRDALGDVGSLVFHPTSHLEAVEAVAYGASETVDSWNGCADSYLSIKEGALDPYTALKRSYIDNRREKILR